MASNRPTIGGGWVRGKVRKIGGSGTASSSASHTRASTPQIQSTSSTIFGGGVKDPSGRTSEFFSMDDQCPVCKSDRYLNPKLRLLVGSCYHKMCESCIDRLFTLGPAPCPICSKVLRKLAFTPQTFEDLTVEKEVSVRRRIAKEFNKRREDFADLRAYNDYLEEVEDITFNLINEIDIPQTEQRIAAYRAANAALIEANIQREEAYAQSLRATEDAERRERELRAAEALRLDEEDRVEREKGRREIIDRLESSDKDAAAVVARSRAEALRRSSARSATATAQVGRVSSRAVPRNAVPDEPHVPIVDDWYAYEDLYAVREAYDDVFSVAVREDEEGVMRAGGYKVEEAWERAVRCSVAGLWVRPLQSVDPAQGGGKGVQREGGDVVMASA